jgi:hypothetical protein
VDHSQREERLKKIIQYLVYFQYIIPDNLDKYSYAIFTSHDLYNYPASSPIRSSTKIIQEFIDIIANMNTATLIRNNIF